jgi:hypothetical protein
MSYLAQGLMSGFSQGFDAQRSKTRDAKSKAERDAERQLRKERQVIEDTRYYAAETNQQERQLAEDARRRIDREDALKRDARDFAFAKDRAATTDLNNTMALARQTRKDFGEEITAARNDETSRLNNDRLTAETELVKRRAADLANPSPRAITPMTTRTYVDEEGATVTERMPGAASPAAGSGEDFSAYEGQKLKGPDGKLYLIKNGRPVPAR